MHEHEGGGENDAAYGGHRPAVGHEGKQAAGEERPDDGAEAFAGAQQNQRGRAFAADHRL